MHVNSNISFKCIEIRIAFAAVGQNDKKKKLKKANDRNCHILVLSWDKNDNLFWRDCNVLFI